MEGELVMTEKYVRKLKEGEMTNFYEVPTLWIEKVRKRLESERYVINDDGTVTKMEDWEGGNS